jgi:phosphatidylglycerol lysyltransferase
MPPETAANERAVLRAARAAFARYGREAMAFQALGPGLSIWLDSTATPGGAAAAYVDTGGSWVAVGLPFAPEAELPEACRAFAASARAAGRRVVWFGAERVLEGYPALRVGALPEWSPSNWTATLRGHRRLREQLRRARAAGVTVAPVSPAAVVPGRQLRAEIDAVAAAWLARRHLEPMQFLVALDLWQEPVAHRYFVACRNQRVVGFLSLVPIPARAGWLFQHLIRSADAPNGTSELLVDLAMRALDDEGATLATLGLCPLSATPATSPARTGGPDALPSWLRLAAFLGRGLYDFRGLRAFKERLHPGIWRDVWLLVPPGASRLLAVLDVLRAFAGGRLLTFVVRSVVRRPSATCLALGLPLVPWTVTLAVLAALGLHGPLGYSRGALGAFAGFDALLVLGLARAARRPRPHTLLLLAGLATLDALVSVLRVAAIGLGGQSIEIGLRLLATAAPVLGATALWSAALRRG